ncbi:hypothetical protein NL676_014778 [Syzygium grande]|nr:hypothetical protein NL676_014778 [Syzygium grande]
MDWLFANPFEESIIPHRCQHACLPTLNPTAADFDILSPMALDLNKALLLPFLSVLALSFPCRAAAAWPPGRNLSVAVPAAVATDFDILSPDGARPEQGSLVRNIARCGRNSRNVRYTPCPPPKNPPARCDVHCRTKCPC